MTTRRQALVLVTGTLAAALIGTLPAHADDGSWDVSYLWSPDLEDVLDYQEEVARALGPEVAKDLAVVRGRSGNWGLIYDRKGTDSEAARRVAASHDRMLRAALGVSSVLATPIRDEGYTRLHNVGYGTTKTLAAAKTRFALIAKQLGPDVHAQLVIENPSAGVYQVVYKRLGDATSTAKVAANHAKVLAKHQIPALAVAERHIDPVWGASSGDPTVLKTANIAARPTSAPKPTGPTVAAVAASVLGELSTDTAGKAPVPAVESTPPAEVAVLAKLEPSSNAGAQGDAADNAAKPVLPPAQDALPAFVASPLRDAINAHIQKLRGSGAIAGDEITSWYVHTLHDERTWAALNAERSLQAASMIKPYVALAFLHQVDRGKLVYGDISKARLEAMIQRSSNTATNWAMAQVGGPAKVHALLQEHYGTLFPETEIVEAIPEYGRTYKNKSSARDYVRFCRALWAGTVPQAEEIRRLMSMPGRDRLVTGSTVIPPGTQVINKTGTTAHLVGDFGIVVAKNTQGQAVPWAFVGIIEKKGRPQNYGSWSSARGRVIRSVSELTYRTLKAAYDLG
jgi:beta-lactamase class A